MGEESIRIIIAHVPNLTSTQVSEVRQVELVNTGMASPSIANAFEIKPPEA